MASLEEQVRAHLDIARGISDVALTIESGQVGNDDEIPIQDVVTMLLATNKALMDCTVDIARAVDQLAEHTGYPLDPPA